MINKKSLLKKVIAKLNKKGFNPEMDITKDIKIKMEISENFKITSVKAFLGNTEITSELTKKDIENIKSADEVMDLKEDFDNKKIKGEQKLEFIFNDFEMTVEYDANISTGSPRTHWEPEEPSQITDLTVYFGKIKITDEIDKKEIEEQIWEDATSKDDWKDRDEDY